MASTFQQQSLRRKIVYTALVVILFVVTIFLRQGPGYGVNAQAEALQVRDSGQSEADLTGAALRLSLSGARGFAVCALWWAASDLQKRHEWNELDILVRSLTKLQPNFITPWMFQSWNLAYNVSVEADLVRDKYYYISRGIDLIAEGDRQNRGNPDLRFSVGFYNQHKIGQSDEGNVLRCLFQMSCIDPAERDPDRLLSADPRTGEKSIDIARFEDFCRKHFQLVRRLRETLKKNTPMEVVEFLQENRKVPSRYEDRPNGISASGEPRYELKPPHLQFPILPPRDPDGRRSVGDPSLPDFDNYHTSRDWFLYAVEPMPPPQRDISVLQEEYDRRKYRMPRYMAGHIFRGYPARGQTYVAEYLEREGWFDTDGWKITDGWFPQDKFLDGREAIVGSGQSWAVRAWERARDMWREHGLSSGLHYEPEELNAFETRAERYRRTTGVLAYQHQYELPVQFRGNKELEEDMRAHNRLYWYNNYRVLTNFPHFYHVSQVEADPKAVAIRKAFFRAEQLRNSNDKEAALELYREAMPKWRDILLAHTEFRRDFLIQEDSYEAAINYVGLIHDLYGRTLKENLVIGDLLFHGAHQVVGAPPWIPKSYFAREIRPNVLTPVDGVDAAGTPLISFEAIAAVRERMKLPMPIPPQVTENMRPVPLPRMGGTSAAPK